jgi:hypothetical protein
MGFLLSWGGGVIQRLLGRGDSSRPICLIPCGSMLSGTPSHVSPRRYTPRPRTYERSCLRATPLVDGQAPVPRSGAEVRSGDRSLCQGCVDRIRGDSVRRHRIKKTPGGSRLHDYLRRLLHRAWPALRHGEVRGISAGLRHRPTRWHPHFHRPRSGEYFSQGVGDRARCPRILGFERRPAKQLGH